MPMGSMTVNESPEEGGIKRCLPAKNRRASIVATACVVALCVALAIYFFARGSGDKGAAPSSSEGGAPRTWTTYEEYAATLRPPDPEQELPASPSILRRFRAGAVCTDAPQCSIIGNEILLKNGSAMDAAVAAMVCNGLVNIQSMGLGGGFLMTVYLRSTGEAYSLNSRETAPGAATEDMLKGDGKSPKRAFKGPLFIGVPGELRGYWSAHRRFGKLPWKSLFEPTLKLCEVGFNMSKVLTDTIYEQEAVIKEDPNLREMFYDESNKKLVPKYSLVKPYKALCETFRKISESDGDAIYNGSLAEDFLQDLSDMKSIITKKDLEDYRPRWADPIEVPFSDDGYKIFSVPPPGSGAVLAFILSILRGFKFDQTSIAGIDSTVLTYHRIVEAFKHAYAKRTLLGDPDFVDVTKVIKNITSPEYAETIRKLIDDSQTRNDSSFYGAHYFNQDDHGTAHISIVAPNGDAISVTSTINYYFGSGTSGKRTGIIVNNVMDDFSQSGGTNLFGLRGSPANAIKPRKAPLSSMSPSIVVDGSGEARMVVGASGGTKITTAVALVIMRSMWFEQNIKEAVDAPRIHHQVLPDLVEYEYGTLQQTVKGLADRGHKVMRYGGRGSIICALYRNATGIYANADYRKGGDVYGID